MRKGERGARRSDGRLRSGGHAVNEWPKRPNQNNHKTNCDFETSHFQKGRLLSLFIKIKRFTFFCFGTPWFRQGLPETECGVVLKPDTSQVNAGGGQLGSERQSRGNGGGLCQRTVSEVTGGATRREGSWGIKWRRIRKVVIRRC